MTLGVAVHDLKTMWREFPSFQAPIPTPARPLPSLDTLWSPVQPEPAFLEMNRIPQAKAACQGECWVRRASDQTIGTFFPEETNGEQGLDPKIHTMGRKNPRPSGFIPVLSGTTQPVLLGVGPISCTALPALHRAWRSCLRPIIAFLTMGEILKDIQQVSDIQRARVSRVIYHTKHTCLKSEQLFSISSLTSPVDSQAHLGTS